MTSQQAGAPRRGTTAGRLAILLAVASMVAILLIYLSLPSFDPSSACASAGRPSDIYVKTLLPPQATCGEGIGSVNLVPPVAHFLLALSGLAALVLSILSVHARRSTTFGRWIVLTIVCAVIVATSIAGFLDGLSR